MKVRLVPGKEGSGGCELGRFPDFRENHRCLVRTPELGRLI
jgi:hypothetical protein